MPHPNSQTAKLLETFQDTKNNPFAFSMHHEHEQPQHAAFQLSKQERSIVREQHKTLFEYDEAMQKLFKNDFEAYFRAIEHPELMIRTMHERMQALEQELEQGSASESDEDWHLEILSQEEITEQELREHEHEFAHDPLYQKVGKWAGKLHELGHQLYDVKHIRDRDIFRVSVNATMVAAKIAYALDIDEEFLIQEADKDIAHIEIKVSIQSFGVCMIFLDRIRESLNRLASKKHHAGVKWSSIIGETEAIALLVHRRMLSLKRRLNEPAE
jgi:hypothetical protein